MARRLTGRWARRLRTARTEGGFTLVELLVAMMIITAVLVTLMAVQARAMVTTAQTRQRTQGTAYANEVMEELRALPWLTLSKGLSTAFQAAGVDPNVTSGMLKPAAQPSINETLVMSSDQATNQAPLSGAGGTNVTNDTDPSIPGTVFVSRAYVTRASSTDQSVTLTVITSWKRNQSSRSGSVVIRSQAYAPAGGCGDASNQPFLGACQALLSSSGAAPAPVTTLTAAAGAAAGTPLLPGTSWTVATLSGRRAAIALSSQQSTTGESDVTLGGGALTQADPTLPGQSSGLAKITNSASNDVGSSGAAPANPADVTGVGAGVPLTWTSGTVGLTLTPGTGVSAMSRASTTASCVAGISAGQPCASATTSGGLASSAQLTVSGQAFTLASVAGGGTQTVFGGRFTSAAGTTTTGCAAISGPGCVSGSAQQSVGSMAFGAGPWSGPAAVSAGLVTVTGYGDSALVNRGLSQRTDVATTTRQGTVSVWNGSSYQVVTLAPLTSQTLTTPTVTWSGSGSTVTATSTVTISPTTSIQANPDPTACSAEGCTIDGEVGTVTVATTWVVTAGASSTSFSSVTVIGGTRATASFKAAPGA